MSDFFARIADLNSRNVRLLNLHQLRTDLWQANLVRGDQECFAFGRGATADEALTNAIAEYEAAQKTFKAARERIAAPPTEDIFA